MREIFRRVEKNDLARGKAEMAQELFATYAKKVRGDEDNIPLEISGPTPDEAIRAANILLSSVEQIVKKGRPLKVIAEKWEVEIIFEEGATDNTWLYEPWTGQSSTRVKDVLQINFTHTRPVRMQYEKRCPYMGYSIHSLGGDMGIPYCGFIVQEIAGRRIPDSEEAEEVATVLATFYDLDED